MEDIVKDIVENTAENIIEDIAENTTEPIISVVRQVLL